NIAPRAPNPVPFPAGRGRLSRTDRAALRGRVTRVRPRARRLREVGAESGGRRVGRISRHDVDRRTAQGRRPRDLPFASVQGGEVRRRIADGRAQGGRELARRPRAQPLRARRQDCVLARLGSAEETTASAAEARRTVRTPVPARDSVSAAYSPPPTARNFGLATTIFG